MKKRITIKKYTNRRLYHTEEKRYITLEQLLQIIRNGDDVEVIDNQTKKDITQETLMQLIVSESQGLFSTQLLHDMIQIQGENFEKFFSLYLKSGMEYFLNLQKNAAPWGMWNPFWMNLKQGETQKDFEKLEKSQEKENLSSKNDTSSDEPITKESLEKIEQELENYKKKIKELKKKLPKDATNT